MSVWRQFTLKCREKSFGKLYEIKASRWWHWGWRWTLSGHVQDQVRCLCVHLQLLHFQSGTVLYRIRDCNTLFCLCFFKQSIVCGYLSMEIPVRMESKIPRSWPVNVWEEKPLFSLLGGQGRGNWSEGLSSHKAEFPPHRSRSTPSFSVSLGCSSNTSADVLKWRHRLLFLGAPSLSNTTMKVAKFQVMGRPKVLCDVHWSFKDLY